MLVHYSVLATPGRRPDTQIGYAWAWPYKSVVAQRHSVHLEHVEVFSQLIAQNSRRRAVNSNDVKDDFGKKIKFILNGGKSSIGLESTIVDLRNKPKILRLGGLETSLIQKVLNKKVSINTNPLTISSPGQFKLHYSPGIPIRLNVKKIKRNEACLFIKEKKKTKSNYYFLSKSGNLKEAARNLYSMLRKIKKNKYKSIAVKKIPNRGLGKTINDRLKRASKF